MKWQSKQNKRQRNRKGKRIFAVVWNLDFFKILDLSNRLRPFIGSLESARPSFIKKCRFSSVLGLGELLSQTHSTIDFMLSQNMLLHLWAHRRSPSRSNPREHPLPWQRLGNASIFNKGKLKAHDQPECNARFSLRFSVTFRYWSCRHFRRHENGCPWLKT